VFVMVTFLICFCRQAERQLPGHIRRTVLVAVFIILVLITLIIALALFSENKNKPKRPQFLPYDITWVDLGLLVIFCGYFVFEVQQRSKQIVKSEDQEYLRKMI